MQADDPDLQWERDGHNQMDIFKPLFDMLLSICPDNPEGAKKLAAELYGMNEPELKNEEK